MQFLRGIRSDFTFPPSMAEAAPPTVEIPTPTRSSDETGGSRSSAEPESRSEVAIDESGDEEIEEKESTQKPFFKCEKDLRALSASDWIDCQADGNSKFMTFVKDEIAKGVGKFRFEEHKGLLYKLDTNEGTTIRRLAVPESLRMFVLWNHHNMPLAAHQGRRRMHKQIAAAYWWPGMSGDVVRWVRACSGCTRRKTVRPRRAGITVTQLATRPNQVVAIDILGPMLESDNGNVCPHHVRPLYKMAGRSRDPRS
jgi:hypothetical protein